MLQERRPRKSWNCAEIKYCLCAWWQLSSLDCSSTNKRFLVLAIASMEVLAAVPSRWGLGEGSAPKLILEVSRVFILTWTYFSTFSVHFLRTRFIGMPGFFKWYPVLEEHIRKVTVRICLSYQACSTPCQLQNTSFSMERGIPLNQDGCMALFFYSGQLLSFSEYVTIFKVNLPKYTCTSIGRSCPPFFFT